MFTSIIQDKFSNYIDQTDRACRISDSLNNQQLFTEVELNSGGYLPSCRGEVNIHHFH